MGGCNVLTSGDFGVYVEGAEKVINMYESGGLSREDLYAQILELDVVYKSVESNIETELNDSREGDPEKNN